MDSDDVRNRFRSRARRDYLGPMPAADRQDVQKPKQEDIPAQNEYSNNQDRHGYDRYTYVEYDDAQYHDDYYEDEYHEQYDDQKRERKTRPKGKIFFFILLGLILVAGAVGGFLFWKNKKSNSQQVDNKIPVIASPEQPEEAPTTSKKTIRLVATGDMMAHDTILKNGKTATGYDFSPMLANMKPFFDKSDIKICNQSTPSGGENFGYSGHPDFNAPAEWARAIGGVGCNVINLGSNQINDKGQGAVDATVAAWDNQEGVLAVVGANRNTEEQAKVRTFEKEGVKFAILSYSTASDKPVTNGFAINMYDAGKASTQVAEVKKGADVVIVNMNWGTEYSSGIDATQDKIAQEIADAGADVVVGHGPHVLEPVKSLKGKNGNSTLVWYSLGNFLNTQLQTEALIGGFAVMDIDTSTKKLTEPKFMPVYMHYEWTPAQKTANDLLARNNVSMYPLDKAAEPMTKSYIDTTVEVQTARVNKLLNQFTKVTVIKSDEF
ncbi:MAG: CapA family protein [Candidatus Saccharimonadales bacterium]